MSTPSQMVVLDCNVIVRRNDKSDFIAAGTPVDASLVPKHILEEHLIDDSKPRKHVPMPKDYSGVRYSRPDGSLIYDWIEHQAAEAKRFEAEWESTGFSYYDHHGNIHEPEVPQEEMQETPTSYVETGSAAAREMRREQP